MVSNYTKYIYATCTDAGKAAGHALAVSVGYKGKGPAFGGHPSLGLRVIGSGSQSPTHWLLYTIASVDRAPYVAEFNSAGPYTLLNAIEATNQFIATCKACMNVEIVDTPADIDAYALQFLAAHNLELMPQ